MNEVIKTELSSKRIVQSYAWGEVVWHVWGDVLNNTNKKEPLVLIHGGSGSWTHWVRNIEYLAKSRSVWALDIPGFGDSSLPDGVKDADELVPYLVEIFSTSFPGQAIDAMGFSFGGMTLGLLAAENPKLVKKMILVGVPGLGLFGEDLPMRGMVSNMTEAQQRGVHRHNLNTMMLARESSVTDDVIEMQQKNVSRDRLRRRRIARTDVLAKAQSKWQCPVHGIWGEKDALYKGTIQNISSVLTGLASLTIVPDAGHWVMFEKPDAFHKALAPLLD
jgi:pimeloyl-ACP methyl ester carboxylesterase